MHSPQLWNGSRSRLCKRHKLCRYSVAAMNHRVVTAGKRSYSMLYTPVPQRLLQSGHEPCSGCSQTMCAS